MSIPEQFKDVPIDEDTLCSAFTVPRGGGGEPVYYTAARLTGDHDFNGDGLAGDEGYWAVAAKDGSVRPVSPEYFAERWTVTDDAS